MRITFGLSLDGFEFQSPRSALGEVVCGPMAMLGLLEQRLGLMVKGTPEVVRQAAYLRCLREAQPQGERFYSRSLEADPPLVAKFLLDWRDQWIAAGWDGKAAPGDGARIRDLSVVETLAAERVATGIADRLRAVLKTLDARSTGIEKITLVDAKDLLTEPWLSIFNQLPHEFQPAEENLPLKDAVVGSDIQRVRDAIRNGDKQVEWKEDGSLLILTAYSEQALAEGVARWITQEKTGKVTLIADSKALALDEALRSIGASRVGFNPSSPSRPPLQVLPLALRLLWKPLDPQHLLEFLTHPVCPVSRILRQNLASAVMESPGIGGERWKSAIEESKEWIRAHVKDDPPRELNRLEEDLREWIEIERYDAKDKAPAAKLAECCSHVAKWAGARSGGKDLDEADRSLFLVAARQASGLASALNEFDRVGASELERFLDEALAEGAGNAGCMAELGHVHRVRAPGAVIEPSDVVVWWNFTDPGGRARHPWSEAEIGQLKAHGAKIPEIRALMERQEADALRPLLAARKCLVLVYPRQRRGEEVTPHSLLDWIQALIDRKPAIRDVRECLEESGSPLRVRTELLKHRPLPSARRWWKLPSGMVLPSRESESFSSAEKFIFSPYAWVLEYHAKLREGRLMGGRMVAWPIQRGNLLHGFMQRVFAPKAGGMDWRKAGQEELNRWIEKQANQVFEEDGANLLLPGFGSEKQRLLATAQRAAWSLVAELRKAGVSSVQMEKDVGPFAFAGGKIRGRIDMLVEGKAGAEAVIDLKHGQLKRKKTELENNLHLQLAVYAFLRRNENKGAWPAQAYCILSEGLLLAQNGDFFPNAQTITPRETPSGAEICWSEFEAVWRWRRQQLDSGWIELTVEGSDLCDLVAGEPGRQPPVPRWVAPKGADQYNAFDALTKGWEGP